MERQRSCEQYGRISQILQVLSIELERTNEPHGERLKPVIVSVCPVSLKIISFFLMSHTLISLSIPPEITCSAVSFKQTAVTWYSLSSVWQTNFFLASHSLIVLSSLPETKVSTPRLAFPSELMKFWCPFIFLTRWPVSVFQTLTNLSVLQL